MLFFRRHDYWRSKVVLSAATTRKGFGDACESPPILWGSQLLGTSSNLSHHGIVNDGYAATLKLSCSLIPIWMDCEGKMGRNRLPVRRPAVFCAWLSFSCRLQEISSGYIAGSLDMRTCWKKIAARLESSWWAHLKFAALFVGCTRDQSTLKL